MLEEILFSNFCSKIASFGKILSVKICFSYFSFHKKFFLFHVEKVPFWWQDCINSRTKKYTFCPRFFNPFRCLENYTFVKIINFNLLYLFEILNFARLKIFKILDLSFNHYIVFRCFVLKTVYVDYVDGRPVDWFRYTHTTLEVRLVVSKPK